ncbi:sure-like protein [Aspergillus taichungensis]|uniref:Sure-like protein n=1 Tax=Aspergillus taichungensis TaxID=482145 RepID=A0A2J5HD75_9EURO|nr:sure-like protein [Aspergillus taichungensis]
MRLSVALPALALPLATSLNIVSSNDDGWAEANVRALHDALTDAGHKVILSAPAENQSGTGSLDIPPKDRSKPCQYNSCPADGPATGHDPANPVLNYVNSYPVTSMKHGLETLAPQFFGSEGTDLAVAGPNVGSNLGLTVFVSGTVGATTYAVKEGHIPAIAFSGKTGDPTAWNDTRPASSEVYAKLASKVTTAVVGAGKPYLPEGAFLNVNFPAVGDDGSCGKVEDVTFVLSRILGTAGEDVETCGKSRLPTESSVIRAEGCYGSVSVGMAENKLDANATVQGVVLERLQGFLGCLP